MNKTFETLENMVHNAIGKIVQVAEGIAKAATTLICLGGSICYEAGVKLRAMVEDNQTSSVKPQTEDVRQSVEDAFNNEVSMTEDPWVTDVMDIDIQALEVLDIVQEELIKPVLLLSAAAEEEVIPEFDGRAAWYAKTGAGRCRKGYRKMDNRCVQIKYLRQQELVEAQ